MKSATQQPKNWKWSCPADHADKARLNYFLTSGDFCHLLINFANSLDPDQDRQNVGPNLDPT